MATALAAGSTCTSGPNAGSAFASSQCQTGTTCFQAVNSGAVCTQASQLGQACAFNNLLSSDTVDMSTCDTGLYCNRNLGTCQSLQAQGTVCSVSFQCSNRIAGSMQTVECISRRCQVVTPAAVAVRLVMVIVPTIIFLVLVSVGAFIAIRRYRRGQRSVTIIGQDPCDYPLGVLGPGGPGQHASAVVFVDSNGNPIASQLTVSMPGSPTMRFVGPGMSAWGAQAGWAQRESQQLPPYSAEPPKNMPPGYAPPAYPGPASAPAPRPPSGQTAPAPAPAAAPQAQQPRSRPPSNGASPADPAAAR